MRDWRRPAEGRDRDPRFVNELTPTKAIQWGFTSCCNKKLPEMSKSPTLGHSVGKFCFMLPDPLSCTDFTPGFRARNSPEILKLKKEG
jgi:hypothetical protein